MRSFPVLLSRALGIALGVLATTMAHGQAVPVRAPQEKAPPPASVHRLVIYQGPNRSVHYITVGNLSTSDRLAAYDLERAENALTYYGDLQSLKQQYLNSERTLEPQRLYVQEQLYGTRITYGGTSLAYGGATAGYGGWGGSYGIAGAYNSYPYGYRGGFGYGYGGYPRAVAGYLGSSYGSAVRSLEYGMGNEGVFKNAMVSGMAKEATPDATAAAVRFYNTAAARAAASPILSRDLGLKRDATSDGTGEPSFKKGSKATIWLGKDKYAGTVKEDRPGWLVLQTDKAEVAVRKSEITRSEVATKPEE